MKGSHEQDEALVLRAQKGDGAATEELLLRYKNAVRARARRFFLVGGETDDLVQEGMIGLYAAICAYRPDGGRKFKNFAYLCVNRRIYDVLRAAERRLDTEDLPDPDGVLEGGGSPEDLLLGDEEQEEFNFMLMKELSDFEYRVTTAYLDGLSYAQICTATGRTMKSVDNALARAKRKLQIAFRKK